MIVAPSLTISCALKTAACTSISYAMFTHTCMHAKGGSWTHVLTLALRNTAANTALSAQDEVTTPCMFTSTATHLEGSGIFTQTDALPWADACWLAKHSGVIGVMQDLSTASHAYLRRDWSRHYAWHSDTDLAVLLQLRNSHLPLFL